MLSNENIFLENKRMKRIPLTGLMLILILTGCSKKKYFFEKELTFPKIINNEQKIKLAAYLVPTPQQYEWQRTEMNAFIHFGMNTFTNREWGNGTEAPALFNPTDFDAEQWVRTLKNAGFRMIILTAKHHDGFCLWPTKTTPYSVASSPWRNGEGDVVREVKDACDKYKMKFGIYLSPWDRNAKSYGDSQRYNDLFSKQLTELLSNYGEISEVWLDGARGEEVRGKIQEYDWDAFYKIIDKLQPRAVKAVMGNDVRWVGNEQGFARETEWSVTPLQPNIDPLIIRENEKLGISPIVEDLGSRDLIVRAKKLYWYPTEANVSIRPGWFYHPEEDHQVKTLKQLVDIYFKSVGRNAVLLLNVPPDKRGLLHETDVERLEQFGNYIATTFNYNKLVNGKIAWTTKQENFKEYDLFDNGTINTIMIQEDIKQGQRVESFRVEALIDNEWKKLADGTTIGYKRLLKFNDMAPSKIRITILETRDVANILNVGAYYAPPPEQFVSDQS